MYPKTEKSLDQVKNPIDHGYHPVYPKITFAKGIDQ
jgi:hypothetical protein